MTSKQDQVADTELRRKHRDHYLALAESRSPDDYESDSKPWMDRIAEEYDNFRNALSFTIDEGDADGALRFVRSLQPFWSERSYASEGVTWATKALDLSADVDSEGRVHALRAAAALVGAAGHGNDFELAKSAVEMARRLGEPVLLGQCLVDLGWVHFYGGQSMAMVEAMEEARGLLESSDDWSWQSYCYRGLAWGHLGLGNTDEAKTWDDRGVELLRKQDRPLSLAGQLWASANLRGNLGEDDESERRREESVGIYRLEGRKDRLAGALSQLAGVKLGKGEYDTARALLEEALDYSSDYPSPYFGEYLGLADLELREADYPRARALYEEAIEVVRGMNEPGNYALRAADDAKVGLAKVAFAEGRRDEALSRLEEAKPSFAESRQLFTRLGLVNGVGMIEFLGLTDEAYDRYETVAEAIEETEDKRFATGGLLYRAEVDRMRGRLNDAIKKAKSAHDVAKGRDSQGGVSAALGAQARFYLLAERVTDALESAKQSLAVIDSSRHADAAASTRKVLVEAALAAGDLDLALEQARMLAAQPAAIASPVMLLETVETLALLAARISNIEMAGLLLGASETRRDALGVPRNTRLQEEVERAASDATSLAEARERGASLAPFEALRSFTAT